MNTGQRTVVGHHHGDRAEQRLQVVGQLRAARVARVHRDERSARCTVHTESVNHQSSFD